MTSLLPLCSDVNDNAPVFQQPAYLASVPEDSVVGSSILQVIISAPRLFPGPLCLKQLLRRYR